MDFTIGPLLGTFHFVQKSHSAQVVLNMAPGTGSTIKSISLEYLIIVLNLCSQIDSYFFVLNIYF